MEVGGKWKDLSLVKDVYKRTQQLFFLQNIT